MHMAVFGIDRCAMVRNEWISKGFGKETVLIGLRTIEVGIELIDLTGDTDVATVDTFEILAEDEPPLEIGFIEVHDATAGTVDLLHAHGIHVQMPVTCISSLVYIP